MESKTPLLDAAMSIPSEENIEIPTPDALDEDLKHHYEGRGMNAAALLWEGISAGEKAELKHIRYLFTALLMEKRYILSEHAGRLLQDFEGNIPYETFLELESIFTDNDSTKTDAEFYRFAKIFLDSYK